MKLQAHPGKVLRFSAVVAITLVLLSVAFALIAVTGTDDGSGSVAQAAGTINVTTLADEYDTTPNSTCSLREAIQSINTDSSFGGCTNPGNADTIQLLPGTHHLSLKGAGETYDNQNGSLYYEKTNGTLFILGAGSDQTVINAQSFNDRVFKFSDNSSDNTTSVTVEGVTIQGGNMSGGYGAGIRLYITSEYASFTLRDVVLRNNQTTGGGGGIYMSTGIGSAILDRVTIYNNQAQNGGGIQCRDQYGVGQDRLELTNVTIYSNTASSSGGGIYMDGDGGGITATNTTIADNKAGITGGNIYNDGTIVRLKNTIVADGISNDCAGNPTASITSLGYNLDSDGSCGLSGTGDLSNTDPKLDSALADNGGSMETLALLEGSPALNQCADCPSIDQRGWTRVTPGPCDMGAYERWVLGLSLPMVLKNE